MNRDLNRDQLIQAAIKAIANGDDGDDHPYGHSDPATDYLSAIAKLLLAQTMPVDAHASPGPLDPEHRLDQHVHRTRCGHTLLECTCGPPIMPKQDWEDPGEDEN